MASDMHDSLTIIPGNHEPKPHPAAPKATDVDGLFRLSCPAHYIENETDIIASSFDYRDFTASQTYPSSTSLIRSAIDAWGHHSHLVLRPDDLWFTILVQMSFYMESNAESVRDIFVSHTGKEETSVEDWSWEQVMAGCRKCIQSRIKTDWMSDWKSPGFTTSTKDDELTATVLMMGVMKP